MDIETIDDLQKAVDNDTGHHRTKNLAELFLNAMTDWPTFDQKKIADFVKELKDFFGHPLTLDKIDSKKLSLTVEHDAWRHEAGSSIAEMIDLSKRLDNENDFDKIIRRLLDHYK